MTKKLTQPVNISTAVPVQKTGQATPSHGAEPGCQQKPVAQQPTLFEVPDSNLLRKPIKNQMSIDGKSFNVEICFVKNSGGLNFYSVETSGSADSFIVKLYMDNEAIC